MIFGGLLFLFFVILKLLIILLLFGYVIIKRGLIMFFLSEMLVYFWLFGMGILSCLMKFVDGFFGRVMLKLKEVFVLKNFWNIIFVRGLVKILVVCVVICCVVVRKRRRLSL